jgi:hypothetical protein
MKGKRTYKQNKTGEGFIKKFGRRISKMAATGKKQKACLLK